MRLTEIKLKQIIRASLLFEEEEKKRKKGPPAWAARLGLKGEWRSGRQDKDALTDFIKSSEGKELIKSGMALAAKGALGFIPSGGSADKDAWSSIPGSVSLGKGIHASKYPTIAFMDQTEGEIKYLVWMAVEPGSAPEILEDQKLGYVCEQALATAINAPGDVETLKANIAADRRIGGLYTSLSEEDPAKQIVEDFAEKAMNIATTALAGEAGEGINGAATVGVGGDDVVDVSVGAEGPDGADCHVKFNDEARFIGLQRKGDQKLSVTQKLLDSVASGEELPDDVVNKMNSAAATTKWKLARDTFSRAIYDRSIKDLEKIRKQGPTEKSDPKGKRLTEDEELKFYSTFRQEFVEYLRGEPVEIDLSKLGSHYSASEPVTLTPEHNIQSEMEKELKKFLLPAGAAKTRPIYFFNFGGRTNLESGANVNLKVKQITASADDIYLEPGMTDAATGASRTDTYLFDVMMKVKEAPGVSGSGDAMPIARIEMRTSGQGHPPQVKSLSGASASGSALLAKEIFNENLVRILVREMLTEAFTKTDEDRIGVLTRKEIDTAWKKELEKKVQTMLDKQVKDAYQNNDFYKVVGKIWKELMKVYAEEQFQQARRFSRYDVPLARIKP